MRVKKNSRSNYTESKACAVHANFHENLSLATNNSVKKTFKKSGHHADLPIIL